MDHVDIVKNIETEMSDTSLDFSSSKYVFCQFCLAWLIAQV